MSDRGFSETCRAIARSRQRRACGFAAPVCGHEPRPKGGDRGRRRRPRRENRCDGREYSDSGTFVSGLTTATEVAGLSEAELLAEIGDIDHYRTKAQFAMANDTAPLPASSGRSDRRRLNRGGNRQLNRIIHTWL
jgi:transposase